MRDLCQQLLSEKLFYVLYDDHDAEEYTHAELRKYRVESGEGAEGQAPASVAMVAPFLLATGDLTDPEELESRAKQIVGGAQHYHEGTLLVKRAEMLKRMELASIFDPIEHCHGLFAHRERHRQPQAISLLTEAGVCGAAAEVEGRAAAVYLKSEADQARQGAPRFRR